MYHVSTSEPIWWNEKGRRKKEHTIYELVILHDLFNAAHDSIFERMTFSSTVVSLMSASVNLCSPGQHQKEHKWEWEDLQQKLVAVYVYVV